MGGLWEWLAVPMEQPEVFGSFHLWTAGIGVCLAVGLAWSLRRLPERSLFLLIGGIGFFLAAAEILKQCFLYEIVYHQRNSWWYFPFQLCSLPLYFCPAIPFMKKAMCGKPF